MFPVGGAFLAAHIFLYRYLAVTLSCQLFLMNFSSLQALKPHQDGPRPSRCAPRPDMVS
jgi:hypothetical protein